jgi:hypothetical protein
MGLFTRNRPVPPPEPPTEEKEAKSFTRFFHQKRSEDHYDRIKTTGTKACSVCDKPFKKKHNPVFLGTIPRGPKAGEKMYTHEKCDCFSKNWYEKFGGCPGLINNGGSYLIVKAKKDIRKKAKKEGKECLEMENIS